MSDNDFTQERKEKYEALRKAGFTSKEANIYKDYTWDYIEVLIKGKTDDLSKAWQLIKGIIDPESKNK